MDLYKFHDKPDKLRGHHEADDIVPARIEPLLKRSKHLVKLNDKQKTTISKDSQMAYFYALQQKARFPEGEPAILKDPYLAYVYALDVIKGRWPEAEDIISTDPVTAGDYALYVLKKPFPKGEPIMLKSRDVFVIVSYVRDVLKKPWPEAEPIIINQGNLSYMYEYADGSNKRFKAAEKFISKDPELALAYLQSVIHGRWPEAEDAIAKSARSSYLYSLLIGERFRKGENVIKNANIRTKEEYERKWKVKL